MQGPMVWSIESDKITLWLELPANALSIFAIAPIQISECSTYSSVFASAEEDYCVTVTSKLRAQFFLLLSSTRRW